MNKRADQINKLLIENEFNGTVCIRRSKETVYEAAYGYADFEHGLKNAMDTTFFTASITKQFTAAAILLLSEAGKIGLDDKINKFIGFYQHSDKIRIRNLLNMSSGIPDYQNDIIHPRYVEEEKSSKLSKEDFFYYATDGMNRCYLYSDVLELIQGEPLLYDPGTKLSYSNSNYQILGYIIGLLSGMSYEEFIRQNILQPLHMENTHLDGLNADAQSYMEFSGVRNIMGRSRCRGADGSIVSNAYDMCKWLDAALYEKLLKKSSWKECFHFISDQDTSFGLPNYGFGWIKNGEWYFHGGCQLGYLAGVGIRPGDQTEVIILSNKCSDKDKEEPLQLIFDIL